MPFIESTKTPYDHQQSWRAPIHATWAARYNPVFCDPRERAGSQRGLETTIFAITGPGTAWGDGDSEPPHHLVELPNDVILFVEVRNSGVHWMQPGDFDIRTMPRTLNADDGRGISSRFRGGFHVGFADGEVWFISNDVGFDRLSQFFTIEGARQHDREAELGPFRQ